MNEELETALSQLIQKTLSGMDAAVGFGQEQLPDVIRQLLIWSFTYSSAVALICMFLLAAIFEVNKYALKSKPSADGESNAFWTVRDGYNSKIIVEKKEELGILQVISSLASISLFGIAVFAALEALKIAVAPKVWLIEYAANLIN